MYRIYPGKISGVPLRGMHGADLGQDHGKRKDCRKRDLPVIDMTRAIKCYGTDLL